MVRSGWLLAALLVACDGAGAPKGGGADAAAGADIGDVADGEDYEAVCGGARPGIETCFEGDFFADCGGTGAPRLGCLDGEPLSCRWFSGGCPAEGYTVSSCSADAICCEELAAGPWPFPDRSLEDQPLERQLYGYGLRPIGPEDHMTAVVAIDAEVEVPQTWSCEGERPEPWDYVTPCTGGIPVEGAGAWMRDTLVLRASTGQDLSGWVPMVEISAPGEDETSARICRYRFTDVVGDGCADRDSLAAAAIDCAGSGNVTLNRMPAGPHDLEDLRGHVTADFGTFTLEGGFEN